MELQLRVLYPLEVLYLLLEQLGTIKFNRMKRINLLMIILIAFSKLSGQNIDLKSKLFNRSVIIYKSTNNIKISPAILLRNKDVFLGSYSVNSTKFKSISKKKGGKLTDSLLTNQHRIKNIIEDMFNNKNSECDSYVGYKVLVVVDGKIESYDLEYPVLLNLCKLTDNYDNLYTLVTQVYKLYSK
jgi:hypothetical protein